MNGTRARVVVLAGSLLFLLAGAAAVGAEVVELKDGLERLAGQLAKSVPAGRSLRVAVADFPDLQGVTSNLGRYVAERLTTRLSVQTAAFQVIERRRLGQILAELQFSMSDLVDPGKAQQLGKMLGVEAIVVGTVSDLGNAVDIDARIIEIASNNILPGITVSISKDDTVRRMWDEGRVTATALPRPPGSESRTSSSGPGQPRPVGSTKEFKIEVLSTEISGGAIKFTLLFTSLLDRSYEFYLYGPEDTNQNFMLDDLGSRYKLAGSSMTKSFAAPPGLPVRNSLAFEAPQAGTSLVHVFLNTNYGRVEIRSIPVPR